MENKMDTKALVKQVTDESDQMMVWTDDKKKDFVGTFNNRVEASQFILHCVARELCDFATKRKFISAKHQRKMLPVRPGDFSDHNYYYGRDTNTKAKAGNRLVMELHDIAYNEAKAIFSKLPSLNKALEIIDPETSKMISNQKKLEKDGQKWLDQLNEIGGELDLDDLDQNTTIQELRVIINKREKRRKYLAIKLDEIGEELSELDIKVSKKLYAGIPGLSESIIKAINSCVEKATGLGQMGRRVEEKVMFGDSKAAQSIFETFEKDEVEISNDIKVELASAVKKLKQLGTKKNVKK